MHTLAKVIEREELDHVRGPRGFVAIDVVEGWLAEGAAVEIVLPARLACARCDGGGCDDCGRSGAIRISGDDPARAFRLGLPRSTEPRVAVRVVRPIGADAGLEQLLIELRAGNAASPCCRRIDLESDRAARPLAKGAVLLVCALAIVLAIALFAVFR